MSDTTITLPKNKLDDEFANYPVGVEKNPSGGWLVMNGDTWLGIAVRNYLPAAQAIARQANGMDPKPGDEYLLSIPPVGNEYGPNREGTCVVM